MIRATKEGVRSEPWKPGKIPASDWPFRPNHSAIRHPRSWQWCVIRFRALGCAFRILIELLASKEICSISLAIEEGDFVRTICVHEFQAGVEPGWHCHAVYQCNQGWAYRGHKRGVVRRYPLRPAQSGEFGIADRRGAMRLAVRFFRLDVTGDLL